MHAAPSSPLTNPERGDASGTSTEFVSDVPPIHPGRSCLVLEVFSGSCRLSKACKNVGFRVAAVDKDVNRSENFPIYQCDITNSNERELLFQYVEAEDADLLHCHFAPICGTASRAREKAPGHRLRDQMNILTGFRKTSTNSVWKLPMQVMLPWWI